MVKARSSNSHQTVNAQDQLLVCLHTGVIDSWLLAQDRGREAAPPTTEDESLHPHILTLSLWWGGEATMSRSSRASVLVYVLNLVLVTSVLYCVAEDTNNNTDTVTGTGKWRFVCKYTFKPLDIRMRHVSFKWTVNVEWDENLLPSNTFVVLHWNCVNNQTLKIEKILCWKSIIVNNSCCKKILLCLRKSGGEICYNL